MKKLFSCLFIAVFIVSSLTGCGQVTEPESKVESNSVSTVEKSEPESNAPVDEPQSRTITDLAGDKIEIPAVEDIHHVVIITSPVTSLLLDIIPDKEMIVGLSPKAFVNSNVIVMEKLFPGYKNVDATFVGDDFSINTEALLQLEPDLIFYYGEGQKKGLATLDIPIINFFSKESTDPKDVTVAWDNLLREIFGVEEENTLTSEWEHSDSLTQELLTQQTEPPKTALCIFSNMGGSLMVSGSPAFDSYAQSFFDKSGIINVAGDIKGTAEVDMEQIYKWNPDMIVIFHNAPAQSYLDNTIIGQDWSITDAWKNGAIYDIPQTAYCWGAPCADSPLMPLWLISKAYPELLSEDDFRVELAGYFERIHKVSLTETDMDSVLGRREVK